MTISERRQRDRTAQRDLIVSTARALAEREGWDAVTTRRLSAEIEYSQPVIYKHFSSLDVLVQAIAVEGFEDLTAALATARSSATATGPVAALCAAYDAWARENPALYDAMFTRATALTFGSADTPEPIAASYAELRAAVASVAGDQDADTLTEVVWAALHGLVLLGRSGRLRPGLHAERLDALVALAGARAAAGDGTAA